MSLGIESGATTTNSLLISDDGVVVQRGRFGPANYALLTEAEILNFFQEIKSSIPENISLRNVGIGMPGVGDASGKEVRSYFPNHNISILVLKDYKYYCFPGILDCI